MAMLLGACGDDVFVPVDAGSADGGGVVDGGVSSDGGVASDASTPRPPEGVDYARVFPEDRVQRLDIVVTAAAWTSLLDDLEQLTGTRPGGGGGGMGPGPGFPPLPAEAYAACVGRSEGQECMFGDQSGVCFPNRGERLGCFVESGGGGGGGTGFWPRKPRYIEAEVRFEGQTWSHVGFRAKGNNSLATSLESGTLKLPFRLKFDEFEDDYPETRNQRFFGFQHLSLANHATDPSYLRSTMMGRLYQRLGVPAPATAFYRVYIDRGEGPEYAGLYTVIEIPDDPMMQRAFGEAEGNLYKPDGDGARFGSYNEDAYFKKNNRSAADFSDMRAFVEALNRQGVSPEQWREGLEASFDAEIFLRYLAVTRGADNWDTYGGMPHNFYMYNHDGKLRFLPWDFDLAMTDVHGNDHFAMADVDSGWPLLSRFRDDPVYFARYRELLGEVRDRITAPDNLVAEIERMQELVRPHIVGDMGERAPFAIGTTEASFQDGVSGLTQQVRSQHQALSDYLR